MAGASAHPKDMADDRPPAPDEARPWTRIDEYVVSLARIRSARRARSPSPRTQPEEPRFALSTLPFLLLMSALLVMLVLVFLVAWPGNAPKRDSVPEAQEKGTAPSGWLDEAEREFR
jgi:hypothetical protein